MKYIVSGQHLYSYSKDVLVASGSFNFVDLSFDFDYSWDGMKKTLYIEQGTKIYIVPLEDNRCKLPTGVEEGTVFISLRGISEGATATTIRLPQRVEWGGPKEGLIPGDPEVQPPIPGGEGVSDHRLLTGRDAPKQHPIKSISGLEAELDRIPEPVEAITNFELEAILK